MNNNIKILNQPNQKLTNTDKKIVERINDNIGIINKMSIIELAKYCYSSISSISRLVKKFGFKTYKDFQIYINVTNEINDEKYKLLKSDADINDKILSSYKYSIDNALSKDNLLKIKEISKKIINSKKIILYGIGSSFMACEELYMNLSKISINSFSSSDFHRILPVVSNSEEGGLLIIFSSKANSQEIDFLIKLAKSKNIATILITSNKSNAIKFKIYKYLIHLNEEPFPRMSALTSRLSQIIIGDYIFMHLLKLKKIYNEKIISSREIVHTWEKIKK